MEDAMNPEDIRYHKGHAWVKLSGNNATVGITDYAQEALGDIVYIDLPKLGARVEAKQAMAEIESTKSMSPVISPVGGRIISVNEELSEAPEIINTDPYGKGWIAIVDLDSADLVNDLMDASEYGKYIENEMK
jgi:glycine cleavage system H protein